MPFKDLDQIFKIQPLRLPIRGTVYEFPGSVSGRTGLLLHRMTEAVAAMQDGQPVPEYDEQDEILDDDEELNLRKEVLGATEAQMVNDGLPKAFIEHVFKTLITWHQFGEEVAKAVWEDVPGAPKAPRDRKPKSRPATSGKASTTKKQGSTTPTSASTKAPRGGDSSNTGD